MRIAVKHTFGQLFLLCSFTVLCGCSGNREETPVIPPVTSPLSRDYIGFGVITNSFTHVTVDPSDNSPSLGYLRRGTLVRIIRRQIIRSQEGFISWVLVENSSGEASRGDQQGWLREDVMEIFSNESQARTASESMQR